MELADLSSSLCGIAGEEALKFGTELLRADILDRSSVPLLL